MDKVLNKQLRYASFEIWDGFEEIETIKFEIRKNDTDMYFNILLNTIKGDWEKIKRIIQNELVLRENKINIIKDEYKERIKKIEDKKERSYYIEKYKNISFRKGLIKKLELKNNVAYFTKYYEKNKYGKKSITELLFVDIGENIILLIEGKSRSKYFKNAKKVWKDFYMSFKPDLSQEYKTPYGSFIVPEGMSDFSKFSYSIDEPHPFSIGIKYFRKEKRKSIDETISLFKEYYSGPGSEFDLEQKTIIIGGKEFSYYEMYLFKEEETQEKYIIIECIDNLDPGLEITVRAKSLKTYEYHKEKLECMLKSFNF
jgi:hypothetical protein